MQRRSRFNRVCLGWAAVVLVGAAAPVVPWLSDDALAQAGETEAPQPALSVAQARAAAARVLDAVRRRDAKARFEQFAPELQAITSPSMIAATMRSQPQVLSYRLLSVRSGINSSIVEADLSTTVGQRTIFLVLNERGQILRYYVDRTDDSASKVALNFLKAVSTGQFITAHSYLSPDFQRDISPQALQSKWTELQRQTGLFVKLGRAVEAETTPDSQLVLVNAQFNRLSENVFIVLNKEHQITGIDFPELSASPAVIR